MKKALLIFAKQPVAGMVKTRLTPPLSPAEAAELYRCMLADTIERVTSIPGVERLLFFQPGEGSEGYFRDSFRHLTLFPQEGAGLGERMENAFGRVLAAGFEAAAVVGTDAPDLPREYVEQSFRLLGEGKAEVVFGPAADGGYYLLALGRLIPQLFRDIPWGTGAVMRKSRETADSLGCASAALPLWHDVDTAADLGRFLAGGNPDAAPRTRRFLLELGV